jgi:dimethylaniline monooxygenase (N-oxide forming)
MTTHTLTPGARVAVVGGGPAGIVMAKELLEAGLEPVVLERSGGLGGQWNAGAQHSAVWPGMCANTSGAMTRFSELGVPEDWPLFPRAEQVRGQLVAYAERFGVTTRVRLGARVLSALPAGDGWDVVVEDVVDGSSERMRVAGVVGCSGRFAQPRIPDDLGPFAPHVEVLHASAYRGREPFRGRRVLVVGNSISGLEIASDLALDGAIDVVSSARRPRFIIPKLSRGVPADQEWFTAFAGLLGQTLEPEQLEAGLRAALLAAAGDPAAAGGLSPDPHLLATGLSQCQHYLPLVAEGRIAVRPGIARVDDEVVTFADGSSAAIDAVILATGYDVSLPYLEGDVGPLVGLTFDAARPGLALMGQYVLHGPYMPVLELQARWIAAVWTGARDLASAPPLPELPFYVHHQLAGAFGDAVGATPDLVAHPYLADALLFGPMLPERYRLDDPAAAARFAAATAGFTPPADQVELHAALFGDRSVVAAVA